MKHNDNESVLKSQMKILELNFEDRHSEIFYQVLIILGILKNFEITVAVPLIAALDYRPLSNRGRKNRI